MIPSIWNWLDHGKCSLWQVVVGEGFKIKSDLKHLLCITTFLGNILNDYFGLLHIWNVHMDKLKNTYNNCYSQRFVTSLCLQITLLLFVFKDKNI